MAASVQIDYWNYLTTQIEYTFNILGGIRYGAYILYPNNLLDIHYINAIELFTQLKRDKLILVVALCHLFSPVRILYYQFAVSSSFIHL